jgi:hypothetical protein
MNFIVDNVYILYTVHVHIHIQISFDANLNVFHIIKDNGYNGSHDYKQR